MNARHARAQSRNLTKLTQTILAAATIFFLATSSSTAFESVLLEGHTSSVFMANLNADGSRAISGSSDQFIRLWEPFRRETVKDEFAHTTAVYTAQYAPDYSYILTSGWDGLVMRWNPDDLTLIDTVLQHQGDVLTVSYSGDGTRIASGGRDTEILISDPASKTIVQRIPVETSVVQSVALNNDATRLAATSREGEVNIWDAGNGTLLRTFTGNPGGSRWVEFHPDGRLATAGLDFNIILWDIESGTEVARFSGHEGTVNCAKFSRDGTRMVSAAGDASVRVWDVESQDEIENLQGHEGSVRYANFGPSNGTVISGGTDNNVLVWYLESADVKLIDNKPDLIDFGDFGRGFETVTTLQISNEGDAAITFTNVDITENPRGMFRHDFSGPVTVQPSASTQFQVWFAPDVLGATSGTMTIRFANGLTPKIVTLLGNGILIVSVDPNNPLDPQAVKIAPNPADDITQLSFALRKAAEVTVMVQDVSGRTVLELPLGALEAGEHMQMLETSSLGSGAYMLVLQAGEYTLANKLQVTR